MISIVSVSLSVSFIAVGLLVHVPLGTVRVCQLVFVSTTEQRQRANVKAPDSRKKPTD